MFVNKIVTYFSIFAKLGKRKHTILPSLIVNSIISILSEIISYDILKNPMAVGGYIIACNVILIIYFSFRDGFKGGYTAIIVTISYYCYILYTRHYHGELLTSGITMIIMLGLLYLLMASVIGASKHIINMLFEREANGRRQLEAIIQQLPVGIIITDKFGQITNANMKIDEIMGSSIQVGSIVGAENSLVTDKKSEKDKRYVHAPIAKVLASGTALLGKEYAFVHLLKKKRVYLNISATPIYNTSNNLVAAASIVTDITDQKELEERKNHFMNMTSHELRTPLTSAKIFLQLAERQLSKNAYATLPITLEKLKSQLDKLQLLVQELLDSTRIQKGKIFLQRETLYIKPLVEEVISDLQITTTHKLELHWTINLLTYSDKEHIRQVLSNLITNAIKFSPKGSRIIISSQQQANYFVISVRDFGIGIAKKDQTKIFEHFYQVSGNVSNPGLGLGLYIASEIVKQHGGKMWLKSTQGKGSIFYFSLPIVIKKVKGKKR